MLYTLLGVVFVYILFVSLFCTTFYSWIDKRCDNQPKKKKAVLDRQIQLTIIKDYQDEPHNKAS